MSKLELGLILVWVARLLCLLVYIPSLRQLIWFLTKVLAIYILWLNLPSFTWILLLTSSSLLIRDMWALLSNANVIVNKHEDSYGPGYDLVFDIHSIERTSIGVRKISGMPGMSFGGSMSGKDIVFYVPANVTTFEIDRFYEDGGDVFILKKAVPWYFGNREVPAWKANIPYPKNQFKSY